MKEDPSGCQLAARKISKLPPNFKISDSYTRFARTHKIQRNSCILCILQKAVVQNTITKVFFLLPNLRLVNRRWKHSFYSKESMELGKEGRKERKERKKGKKRKDKTKSLDSR